MLSVKRVTINNFQYISRPMKSPFLPTIRRFHIIKHYGRVKENCNENKKDHATTDVRTLLNNPKTLKQISSYLTVERDTTVSQALALLKKHNENSILVTENQKIFGMFTEREYLKNVVVKQKDPNTVACGDVVTRKLHYLGLTNTFDQIISTLTANKLYNIPILNLIDVRDTQAKYYKKDIVGVLPVKEAITELLTRFQNTAEKTPALMNIKMGPIMKGLSKIDYLYVRESDSIQHVAQTMNDHEVDSVLVTEGSKTVTGLVTSVDFARKIPSLGNKSLANIAVKNIMTPTPICISPDFTLYQTLHTLLEKNFKHLPFMDFIGQTYDQDARILGVISVIDLLEIIALDTRLLRLLRQSDNTQITPRVPQLSQ